MFRASIHCGYKPEIVKAEPEDLVIVCGEASVETENQENSEEHEVALKVLEYHNHPLYDPRTITNGHDISVYIVADDELKKQVSF